jgi:hypothetical protein
MMVVWITGPMESVNLIVQGLSNRLASLGNWVFRINHDNRYMYKGNRSFHDYIELITRNKVIAVVVSSDSPPDPKITGKIIHISFRPEIAGDKNLDLDDNIKKVLSKVIVFLQKETGIFKET